MDIRVSGHQVETGEALKQHVSDRLEAFRLHPHGLSSPGHGCDHGLGEEDHGC